MAAGGGVEEGIDLTSHSVFLLDSSQAKYKMMRP